MKKFLTLTLAAVLLLTLFVGCGKTEEQPETTVPANDETTAAATTEESTTKAPDKADDGNAKGGCGAVLGSTAWVSLGLIALCGAVVAKKAKK